MKEEWCGGRIGALRCSGDNCARESVSNALSITGGHYCDCSYEVNYRQPVHVAQEVSFECGLERAYFTVPLNDCRFEYRIADGCRKKTFQYRIVKETGQSKQDQSRVVRAVRQLCKVNQTPARSIEKDQKCKSQYWIVNNAGCDSSREERRLHVNWRSRQGIYSDFLVPELVTHFDHAS